MYNFLNEMGFVDITDTKPIKFFETIIGTNSYIFDKRFIRNIDEVVTMIMIGNDSGLINIYIKTCLGDKYSECYQTNIPNKYCELIINDLITKNEKCVNEL